ncbi:MAG: hypothetical protein ACQETV_04565 [Actinomycetota bacterium]
MVAGLALVLAALLLLGDAAAGQDVVEEVLAEGYLVEPGADDVDEADLRSALEDARGDGVDLVVAFLASEAAGGAEALADDLVEAGGGVALVVTPEEVGGASAQHGDADVDAALDAALARLGPDDDPVEGVRAFAASLGQGTGSTDGADVTDSLPGPLGDVGLGTIVVGVVVLLVVLSLLRRVLGGGRRRRRGYGGYGRRRGGLGRGLMGGLLGGAIGGRMGRRRGGYGGGATTSMPTRTAGGTSRPRSGSAARSRRSSSRRRGSGGRSRGGGSRRRR